MHIIFSLQRQSSSWSWKWCRERMGWPQDTDPPTHLCAFWRMPLAKQTTSVSMHVVHILQTASTEHPGENQLFPSLLLPTYLRAIDRFCLWLHYWLSPNYSLTSIIHCLVRISKARRWRFELHPLSDSSHFASVRNVRKRQLWDLTLCLVLRVKAMTWGKLILKYCDMLHREMTLMWLDGTICFRLVVAYIQIWRDLFILSEHNSIFDSVHFVTNLHR